MKRVFRLVWFFLDYQIDSQMSQPEVVMASLMDALQDGMVANLNPMNAVMRKFAEQQVAQSNTELDTVKLDTMDRLRSTIADCIAKGEDDKVIAAYQRMLDRYTS
jgi:hypothetical protein